MPTRTLADRLLEADALVFAREDPARPFHYAAVEVLKGDPGDAPIDAFLPSMERRLLARYPARRMLLARAGPETGWSALGATDGDYERVVRRIVAQAGTWRPMETDNRQRLAEFVPLLGHGDARLHQLAYLEIGRAPYSEIRRIATEVPIETVRGMLDDPRYLEWRSLAILMLAQSGLPGDRERIRSTFDGKQRLGSLFNLAAWATAYVGIDGPDGVEQIRRLYLSRPGRSTDELREIVRALSVSASGDASLRAPVAAAYRDLLQHYPSLAPAIVHDLIAWRRWDLVGPIAGIRPAIAAQDPLAAHALGIYLRAATAASQPRAAAPALAHGDRPPTGQER